MEYYESQGLLEAPQYTLPGFQVNHPGLQNMHLYDKSDYQRIITQETLPYNDCLYRNMYKFKYLAILESAANSIDIV